MEDTKQMQENPELSLEEQDRSRRRKKKVRAAMSFGIMALLLLALFFASLNIGSLKVSLSEMLRGMLGEVSENAATVFCILRSRADSEAFQSGRYAEHNGRPKTLKKVA